MDLQARLTTERRTRLATERLLDQMKSELGEANRQLALHARDLTNEIVLKRTEMGRVRSETRHLKTEVSHARENLERAESAMVIAERRLWDSLETIRDGFAVFGPDNRLIVANRSYLALFDGLEMVKPGIDMAFLLELMADEGIVDIGDQPSRAWQAAMLARLRDHRIEHATLKMWNEQYIQFIDRRTRDGDLVTLALNITEQTKREVQLREARQKAESANRAKSAFLANMSHEIRTPMNGVIAMAELLADTPMDDEQRSYLETIRSSGEALLVIINDVLDYSKIEADKIEFKAVEFDLEQCIHDVVLLLQPGALEKGLQLAVDFDLFLPTRFVGDAGRLRQILTNLVGNALKFTEEGHVLIRVIGLPTEDEGICDLHITVEDTGIGIPEDKLDAIFHEFQQVENETDRGHDGTGLGLAITQKLVRAMGGDVWVESRVGVGSGFGVSLPLPVVAEVSPDSLAAPGWMKRAIVADVAGMNRDVLVKQLGLIGLDTVPVQSLDALREAAPGPADVVFLDAGLMKGDAFAAAADLKATFEPAGLFLLVNGPTKVPEGAEMAYDFLLKRPVLRATMIKHLIANAPRKAEPEAPAPPEEPVAEVVHDAEAMDAPVDPSGPTAEADPVGDAVPCEAATTDDETFVPGTYGQVAAFEGPRSARRTSKPIEPAPERVAPPDDVVALEPPETGAPERRRMRVLAAEDNKTNRFVFEKMLKGLEIDLVFAENGLEAVAEFEAARPDIFFTDISMPKMDGKEATRRIREIERDQGLEPCPIVAITAHAMEGDADDILAAGVDHYLTKPLKKQLLFDHIVGAQPLDALPVLPVPDETCEVAEPVKATG